MIGFGRKKHKDKPSNDIEEKKNEPIESPSGHLPSKKLPALFSGLSEKQINQLYSTAIIKKMNREEFLFQKGDKPDNLYIIMEGWLEMMGESKGTPSRVHAGSVAGLNDFFHESTYTESAKAMEPSVIMILSKTAMAILEDPIRAFIYEKIIRNNAAEMIRLKTKSRVFENKVSSLAKSLYSAKTAGVFNYSESDLILNIIKKIPKLPAYTHTLSSRLLDENVSSKEVVDLIKQDPALVADVLKSVNSSYYGLEQKVSDMNSAVLLLGFQSLYQLVVSEGIRRTMPDTADFREIHAQALALSYISFSLSMTAKVGVPVQISTIGLLHNLGESVVSLLKQRNPNLMVFIDALDRPSLGAFLLDGWNFPAIISKTVKYQNFPEFSEPSEIPEDVLQSVAILYISRICYDKLKGVPDQDLPLLYFDEYRNLLKLKDLSLEDITRNNILVDLKKKRDTLPLSLKELINS
ncbi:MAG: HDOD domain-containing protein [Proteobacteria bacterium]|nr:HDOD domain-containing protein [Pseudomonadota bacterium]